MGLANGAQRMWLEDRFFLEAATDLRTLIDPERLYILYQYVRHTLNVPGDLAECGVYRGGSALLLAKTLYMYGKGDKTLHLFDTFQGMPPANPELDLHKEGDFADTSLEEVQNYLAGYGTFLRFYPGVFELTFPAVNGKRFSFVHVDCDLYASVKLCCSFFYTRLNPGGVLIFDDYGFPTCPGAKRAVDEFFAAVPEYPVYLPTGQAVVTRLPGNSSF
ncbi:MAG: TylF/MycF/NovP-related O-methyltransferase [Bacillota bacterium]